MGLIFSKVNYVKEMEAVATKLRKMRLHIDSMKSRRHNLCKLMFKVHLIGLFMYISVVLVNLRYDLSWISGYLAYPLTYLIPKDLDISDTTSICIIIFYIPLQLYIIRLLIKCFYNFRINSVERKIEKTQIRYNELKLHIEKMGDVTQEVTLNSYRKKYKDLYHHKSEETHDIGNSESSISSNPSPDLSSSTRIKDSREFKPFKIDSPPLKKRSLSDKKHQKHKDTHDHQFHVDNHFTDSNYSLSKQRSVKPRKPLSPLIIENIKKNNSKKNTTLRTSIADKLTDFLLGRPLLPIGDDEALIKQIRAAGKGTNSMNNSSSESDE